MASHTMGRFEVDRTLMLAFVVLFLFFCRFISSVISFFEISGLYVDGFYVDVLRLADMSP
jgi:hypothetical protein